MEKVSAVKSFGGQQLRYSHYSDALNCQMHFSIYLPPNASDKAPVPVIYWLSGLTCTDENFVQKAGAQAFAAKYNIAIVAPDTSPRGDDVPDDPEGAWDFGLGAGFYVDAVQEPWNKHYKMYSYVTEELPSLVEAEFPLTGQRSIMGHSMGGHGALVIALKNPGRYACVSAFAPICAPSKCSWGQKAFSRYLGSDVSMWEDFDTCVLINRTKSNTVLTKIPIWVEQGELDSFKSEQLMPELLQKVSSEVAYPLQLTYRSGYDHSYFFIASFIGAQIANHAGQFR